MFLPSAYCIDLPPSSSCTRFTPVRPAQGGGLLGVDDGKSLSAAVGEHKPGTSRIKVAWSLIFPSHGLETRSVLEMCEQC